MNGMSIDSTKLLTEKLALARELATLKPELEHLRSQAAYQQTVLSEKLALQRQLSTLEVELETEKRATKRIFEKSKNKDKEVELQQRIDDLQKELAREKREKEKAAKMASNRATVKGSSGHEGHPELQQKLEVLQKTLEDERRDREKARNQMQKDLDDAESRSILLEGKLDLLRTKMRAIKEELKECQTELEVTRGATSRVPSTAWKGGDNPAKSARKRPATEMSTDLNIGTPDGGPFHTVKRGKMDQTSRPGEKSNFSITPYLNRTVSKMKFLAQEYSEDATETTNGTGIASFDDSQPLEEEPSGLLFDENSPSARQKFKPKKVISDEQATEKRALGEVSSAFSNKIRDLRPSRSISLLGMVTEEFGNENTDSELAPTTNSIEKEIVTISKVPVKGPEEAGPRKKKRKLLSGGGKTIFDEIEASTTKRPAKVSLGRPRSVGKGIVVAGTKGIGRGVFGTFSPLKKEKKSLGGSILA
jgi:hypothetical protein